MTNKDLNQIVDLETDEGVFEIKLRDIYEALNEHGYTIVKVYDTPKRLN